MAKLTYTRGNVDRILNERIRPYCDGRFMPSVGWFKENGLNGLYATISQWKVEWYDDYKDFCKKNRLIPGGKNPKWNFRTVNAVFNEKIRPFCKGEFMPSTTWFRKNGFWTLYHAIRQGKVEWYENYKDFCEKQGYKPAIKERTWDFKTVNEEFQKRVKPFCTKGYLPGYRWFVRNGLGGWFATIDKWDIPEYGDIDDFCVKKWLMRQNKWLTYTKERTVKFFAENILPNLESKTVTHYDLARLWFTGHYGSIVTGKVDWLWSIQELLDEFGLLYWKKERKVRGVWNQEKIDQVFSERILPHCENNVFPGCDWCTRNRLSSWKEAVYSWRYGYENMQDFLRKNHLVSLQQSKSPKWTEQALRHFFTEHILLHCRDGFFISRSSVMKIIGWATWYDTCGSVLRRKLAHEYGLLYREPWSGRPK